LCIELVIHVKSLPQKMLDLAEQHNFPIIGFTDEVRFIDITKDLHELLIGHHEDVWWRLESLHNELSKELTSNGNAGDFLRILHKETNKQTALKYEDQYRFFPSPSKKQQYKWMNTLESNTNQAYVTQPITLFGSTIAHLYIIEPTDKINQFDQLAMKRCGEILGQFFWKHHQQKEAQQMKKNEWIFEAITGSLTHEEIVSKIQLELPNIRLQEAMIAVIPFQKSLLRTDSDHVSETALLILLEQLFLEYSFHLFTVQYNTRNIYILLLINQQSDDVTNRIEKALQAVHNNNDPLIHNELQWMSFGRMITNYGRLGKSYETALSTLNYQQNIEILNKPFYNNLAVYRLIDRINNKNDLKEIIEDYLAPLIEYDRKKGTELLKTVQVFFKNLGTRSKTAEELNIVRQTLYHRLNRIESLIGKDYMEPQNSMMIEFSMYALKYVDM